MKDLRNVDISKLTPDQIGELQQYLIDQGYDLGKYGADKNGGRLSKAALADYNANYKENPIEEGGNKTTGIFKKDQNKESKEIEKDNTKEDNKGFFSAVIDNISAPFVKAFVDPDNIDKDGLLRFGYLKNKNATQREIDEAKKIALMDRESRKHLDLRVDTEEETGGSPLLDGALQDFLNFQRGKRKASKVQNQDNPTVDMHGSVTPYQLGKLAEVLPDGLTPESYTSGVGDSRLGETRKKGESRYVNTGDSKENRERNDTGVTRSLGSISNGLRDFMPKTSSTLDLAKTSLETPGRGTIGGFSLRTSPEGIGISDGYEFAASPDKIITTDDQSDNYNNTRKGINENYRAKNNTKQNYFISGDVYNKRHSN